jgi:SHS2 domain-containing protein
VYRWVEHGSEVEVLIEDESAEAVFTEALVAIGELLADRRGGDPVTHEFVLGAVDRPALLVEWLNELVYLAETDGFVPERILALELGETTLAARIAGGRTGPQTLIKGATYHGLELGESEGAWRARVVLDV